LDNVAFAALSRNPKQIEQELAGGVAHTAGGMPLVVIDEIQRLPELLNEIHRLIERRSAHFVLTGSSARKLRRGGVSLLGGRAHMLALRPFVHQEAKSGRVGPGDLKGLRALRDERALRNYLCVTTAGRPRFVDDIRVLPISDFLNELWGGAFG
jgi:predicted AAA+ superfamily ATPase